MRIPHKSLAPDTLHAVLEEFVTREGTEYGERDFSLEEKVEAVLHQLDAGTAFLVYDEESGTCSVVV